MKYFSLAKGETATATATETEAATFEARTLVRST